MDKIGDIDLFVRVVKNRGLAATARELKLSPASVTVKINRLEAFYGVKLLKRTTRQISLTEEGKIFYERCIRILAEVHEAEEQLRTGRDSFSGSLSVTAPVDIGQTHIAPLLARFSKDHPAINAKLYLNDGVTNLINEEVDIGVRYGILQDNRMVARRLARSRRVVCASPSYVERFGKPEVPEDLTSHRCLTMIREREPLTEWHFSVDGKQRGVAVNSVLSSNNGAQIRTWALDGYGIALKSVWDIDRDLQDKKLVLMLEDYTQDFEVAGVEKHADLHVIYPNREFLPRRIGSFIELLIGHFSQPGSY